MKMNTKSDKQNAQFLKYKKMFVEVRSKIYKAFLGAKSDFRLNLTQSLLSVGGFLLTTFCIVSILFTAGSVMLAESYEEYLLGSNSITLKVEDGSKSNYLDELRSLKTNMKRIREVVPIKDVADVEMSGNQKITSFGRVIATDETYFSYAPIKIEDGKSLTAQDIGSKNAVAVISRDIANQLYGESTPIGQEIKLNNQVYKVVGILSGIGKFNPSKQVIIPYTSARLIMNSTYVDTYTFVGVDTDGDESKVIKDFIAGKTKQERTITSNNGYSVQLNYESNDVSFVNKIGFVIYFIMLFISGLGLILLNMFAARRSKSRSELSRKKLRRTYCIFKSEFFCLFVVMIGSILGALFGLLAGIVYCNVVNVMPVFNLVLITKIFEILGISLLFSIIIGIVPGLISIKTIRRDMV